MAMVAATHGRWIQSRYVHSTMGKIMLTYVLPPVKHNGLGRFLVPAEGKDQESAGGKPLAAMLDFNLPPGNMIEEAETNLSVARKQH